jgi:hypothetical protein
VSGNIAVIYARDPTEVARAFAQAAAHLAADVRLMRLVEGETSGGGARDRWPTLRDLEWANGIAFGTPFGDGAPVPELMRFIASTDPQRSRSRLRAMYDKVVTVFGDEPEHMAREPVLHAIYDALYGWGAVSIGPRGSSSKSKRRLLTTSSRDRCFRRRGSGVRATSSRRAGGRAPSLRTADDVRRFRCFVF